MLLKGKISHLDLVATSHGCSRVKLSLPVVSAIIVYCFGLVLGA